MSSGSCAVVNVSTDATKLPPHSFTPPHKRLADLVAPLLLFDGRQKNEAVASDQIDTS